MADEPGRLPSTPPSASGMPGGSVHPVGHTPVLQGVGVRSATKSPLAGVNVLIEGLTGTGKTYALGTLVDSGIETFVLFTESGLETLLGYYTDPPPDGRGLSYDNLPGNLHWHMMPPLVQNFEALAVAADRVNQISLDAWAKITDPERGKFNRFVDLLRVLNDFPDDRTGRKFGPVDKWGTGRAIVVDSLTGLGHFAMALVVGGKPVKSQPEWGAAQDQLERLLRQLCDGCRCHFVLLSHQEREVDQVMGGVKLTVSTLGRALAPKIPPMFSDVVMSYREGAKFLWTTANQQADLKKRNLPLRDAIDPSFKQIIEKWKSRGGIIEPE